ncbi:MAG TPA: hypothetical protein EYN93_15860 [Planctomycetaceae bacterium]|nr:hypothetical protein [Planctomycetaceae bacterium]
MASTKEYYWRKSNPAGNPVRLKDGSNLPFEEVVDMVGFAIVGEEVNKELEAKVGGGMAPSTKAEYDELKKKPPSTPSGRQWREELRGDVVSGSAHHVRAAAAAEVEASAAEPKTAVEKQAKAEVLPQETKPKAGKRKGKK